MRIETLKKMFDACYQAKRARDLLPPLPDGVTSSYIHYLDAIQILEKQEIHVKVSDISDALNLPRPGVTRTVKEMETKGYLQKIASPDDGRVTYIAVTRENSCRRNIMNSIFGCWFRIWMRFRKKMHSV